MESLNKVASMTHHAVLRHGFDIHRNPDRLGPPCDETYCLLLNPQGLPHASLEGTILWLISWEGFMKPQHVLNGWFRVSHVGKRHGVVAQHYLSGNDGSMFARGLGPLDSQGWFPKFIEAHRRFRDGEPTDVDDHVEPLLALTRAAGFTVPAVSAWDEISQGPAAF